MDGRVILSLAQPLQCTFGASACAITMAATPFSTWNCRHGVAFTRQGSCRSSTRTRPVYEERPPRENVFLSIRPILPESAEIGEEELSFNLKTAKKPTKSAPCTNLPIYAV